MVGAPLLFHCFDAQRRNSAAGVGPILHDASKRETFQRTRCERACGARLSVHLSVAGLLGA
jgi:hypothetical protein